MATLGAAGSEYLAAGMGSLAGAVAKFASAADLGRTEGGLHDRCDVKMIGKAHHKRAQAKGCQDYKAGPGTLGIGNPKRAIRCDFNRILPGFVLLIAEEVAPVFRTDEVELVQGDGLALVGNVVNGEDALVAVGAFAPEGKELIAEVEGELGGVGVEGDLLLADRDAALEFVKKAMVVTLGIVELLHKCI